MYDMYVLEGLVAKYFAYIIYIVEQERGKRGQ